MDKKTAAPKNAPRCKTSQRELASRVAAFLRRHEMARAGDRVGVAVSGGADSVALLLLLEELRERLGIQLSVVHFNHQLRGEESQEDERFVRELANAHGLEFYSAHADVAAEAKKARANVEDTGRRLRYAFFERVVAEGDAARVAVAHTADDQAETVLARILRGTGPAGLGGIYPVSEFVIRPLLEIRRNELRDYLRARKQSWREDTSNIDLTRTRARIRHVLLPLLEGEFQPATVEHLGGLAELAREDEAFWRELVEARFELLVERLPAQLGSGGEAAIAVRDLLEPLRIPGPQSAPAGGVPETPLAKRLVRRIVAHVKRARGAGGPFAAAGQPASAGQLAAAHVDQVLRLAREGSSGQSVELPGGVRVMREFDRLIFSPKRVTESRDKAARQKVSSLEYAYSVSLDARAGAAVQVAELGSLVRLKVIDWPPPGGQTNQRSAVVDRDRLRTPLVLRNWRPGDAFRPLGRANVRKLKRLFLEKRVGLRARAGWPVLTSGGTLVWARGLPVAAEYAPREGTRAGVEITEESL
jgi:tRNA(Ile)-lysidine synthase